MVEWVRAGGDGGELLWTKVLRESKSMTGVRGSSEERKMGRVVEVLNTFDNKQDIIKL